MKNQIITFAAFLSALVFILSRPISILAANPVLRLQADSTQVEINQEFEVEIYLDTLNQQTVGVDAFLTFDTGDLEVLNIEGGLIYPNYPAMIYDNGTGEIKIGGSANYNNYFDQSGVLATIRLKAEKLGQTTIDFIWNQGRTNETNVVSLQIDDLLTTHPAGLTIDITDSSDNESDDDQGENNDDQGEDASPVSSPAPEEEDKSFFSSLISRIRGESDEKEKEEKEKKEGPVKKSIISPEVLGAKEQAEALEQSSKTAKSNKILWGTVIFLLLAVILLLVLLIKQRKKNRDS